MDTFSKTERSDIMRKVRSKDTSPERKVRSLLHRMGFRFRLHRKDLPGNPDIVLPKHSAVVFVHGCFWHRHPGCSRTRTPASRREYWLPKFDRTVRRDADNQAALRRLGWKVIIVWECELRDAEDLEKRLSQALLSGDAWYENDSVEVIPLAAEDRPPYGGGGNAE